MGKHVQVAVLRYVALRSWLNSLAELYNSNQQSTALKTLKDLNDEHSRLNVKSSNRMDEIRRDILLSTRHFQQSIDEQKIQIES